MSDQAPEAETAASVPATLGRAIPLPEALELADLLEDVARRLRTEYPRLPKGSAALENFKYALLTLQRDLRLKL